jgi:23S rRNA (pseudouridine1915-N3)-methyltransferase
MTIEIISVSNKQDSAVSSLISDYQKRMRDWAVNWRFISPGEGDVLSSKRREATAILKHLESNCIVVLLDETGHELSSPGLAAKLDKWQQQTSKLVFIIGGAYGVDDSIKERADFEWSLSRLVFPHQLVQIILAEQIYRAKTILANHPYHHGS